MKMKQTLNIVVLIFLLLFFGASAFAQDAIPKDKIVFAPSLEHAQLEAKERNCPILAIIQDSSG